MFQKYFILLEFLFLNLFSTISPELKILLGAPFIIVVFFFFFNLGIYIPLKKRRMKYLTASLQAILSQCLGRLIIQ